MTARVGIGIIGMGFMGQTHARAYLADRSGPGRLAAVCDRDPDRRSGVPSGAGNIGTDHAGDRIFEPSAVTGYADPDDLIADPSIDLVSICTHTDTHVELAERCLSAGKHVLVEKPVATDADEIARLAEHADGVRRLCIPAMCMRHWPGWSDLRSLIEAGDLGEVVHARFERLGAAPAWGGGFYADTARSGGALFDLHVHDADMAYWLFGRPDRVHSIGDDHHIATQYVFASGPAVQAEGGWLNDTSFPFRMAFTVEFERGVASFDSARDDAMMLHADGEHRTVRLKPGTGYDHQAAAVVRAIAAGDASGLPTLRDAVAVTRMIEAERRSARERRPIDLPR